MFVEAYFALVPSLTQFLNLSSWFLYVNMIEASPRLLWHKRLSLMKFKGKSLVAALIEENVYLGS